ncbi:MFS transporter [Verrucomicrobiota bacterium]
MLLSFCNVAAIALCRTDFVITMTFPVFLKRIGLGGAYGIYAGFAFLSIFFVSLFVKETRGKTLEEMCDA